MRKHRTTALIPYRRDWRIKLIEATRGNQTLMGCIVLQAINKKPGHPPFFTSTARITAQGEVMAHFMGKDGLHENARVCSDRDLVENCINLCRHCDLNEVERIEFLARINAWIEVDDRSVTQIRKVMLVE